MALNLPKLNEMVDSDSKDDEEVLGFESGEGKDQWVLACNSKTDPRWTPGLLLTIGLVGMLKSNVVFIEKEFKI